MDKATYKEILESLRRDILGGKYGHALPSVGALVRKYGVARATVHHSLEELFHQGLIRGIADVLGPKRFTAEKNIFRARSDSVAAVRSCMKRHRPDAVICRNDAAAAMLKQALEACGISVPRDVMLVGFDDVNIARLTQITSIRQPCDSIARAAFRRLVDRIEDPSMEPAEIYLNAPLVRRGSTDRKNRGKPTTTEEMHP